MFLSPGSRAAPRKNRSMVLLNTLIANNSTTLFDLNSFSKGFFQYEIVFNNILAGTAGGQTLEIQVHSGNAFQTSSYLSTLLSVASGTTGVTNPTTYVPLGQPATVLTTGAGLSGSIRVSNPANTLAPKNWYGGVAMSYGGTVSNLGFSGGFWNGGNGALDGFQVLLGSGNIASGTVKVYGIA